MKKLMNKKGLSTIITTLIIILLSFVAIGIIWVVVQEVISGGTDTVDYQSKCVLLNLQVSSAKCYTNVNPTPSWCDVSIFRAAGGDAIGGVKIVITNSTGGNVIDKVGGIEPLATKNFNISIIGGVASTIEIKPYLTTATGEQYICA